MKNVSYIMEKKLNRLFGQSNNSGDHSILSESHKTMNTSLSKKHILPHIKMYM